MKSLRFLLALVALLFAAPAPAQTNPPPAIAALNFLGIRSATDLGALADASPWIRDVRQFEGAFDSARGVWIAPSNLPFGHGSLVVGLRRDAIPADLALTLVYAETPGADFIVQLWDPDNNILAADLFSNIVVAGREAQTDTFILDLARYPTAAQIALRRLSGEIQIFGLVLTPVACEVPLAECDDYELSLQFDRRITPDSPTVQATAQIAPHLRRTPDWNARTIQQPVDVAAQNPYARVAFAANNYPDFAPSAASLSGQLIVQFTASSLLATDDMLRQLNAYHPDARGSAVPRLSSADSLRLFLDGQTRLCMMSIPMSSADRERFYRSRGYPPIELPAALDPIVVVVHPDNPISQLSLPQLDAIFGTELRAGAQAPLRAWGDLGLGGAWATAPIALWGGAPQTGTRRLFQRTVLQDGPFRDELQNDPDFMYQGVILHVANDPHAIGFCNAQHGTYGAKALALSPQTGLPAVAPTPDAVYSGRYPLTRSLLLYVDAPSLDQLDPLAREFLNVLYSRSGQTAFARRNQAPLPAEKVREIRALAGFP